MQPRAFACVPVRAGVRDVLSHNIRTATHQSTVYWICDILNKRRWLSIYVVGNEKYGFSSIDQMGISKIE